MLSVYFSVLLVGCGLALGFGLPWLSVHLERARQREGDHVAELYRQRDLIADYEATIKAYRQFAQNDPELALTALEVSPSGRDRAIGLGPADQMSA